MESRADHYRRIIEEKNSQYSKLITFKNWWTEINPHDFFLVRFIHCCDLQLNREIRFYSVFGKRREIDETFSGIKIFFTPENIHPNVHYPSVEEVDGDFRNWNLEMRSYFSDHALNSVHLSLGYDKLSAANYLRLPLWITYFFSPWSDQEDVQETLNWLQYTGKRPRPNDAVLVASHDTFGVRKKICSDLSETIRIDYAGHWNQSTDILYSVYNNDKLALLGKYKFNICPENQDAPYYVTEKLFQAYQAGCIPIYHGALNDPEPEVLDPDAMILWDFDGNNKDNYALIDKLAHDEKARSEFIRRPRFKQHAAEYIMDMLSDLRSHMTAILS